MSDPTNHPFGLPGGGLPGSGIPGAGLPNSGIPGTGPSTGATGPSLTKPSFQVPEPRHPGPDKQALVLAGWGYRFAGELLDRLIRALIVVPIPIIAFLLIADHPFSDVAIRTASDVQRGRDGLSNLGAFFIAWWLCYGLSAFLYAPITMSRLNGATFGKKMVGIRVVMDHGGAPSFGESFLREPIIKGLVCSVIGGALIVPALLNYLWPLWDIESRAGHDFMAGTRVVSDQSQSYSVPPFPGSAG